MDRYKKLQEDFNIDVRGLENYPKDGISIVVANHSRLLDIFYLPASLPQESISLISARLVYKKIKERQDLVEKYLYAIPIEAHGGGTFINLCFESVLRVLNEGISINMFPEGAYVEDQSVIYRGRTGASQILFSALELGLKPHFVPVAIDVSSKNSDLDNFIPNVDDEIHASILKPIDYESYFREFRKTDDLSIKNTILHQVTDQAMADIAKCLNRPYAKEYIELYPKGNVMFSDGSTLPVLEANSEDNVNRYRDDLSHRTLSLINKIK